MLNIFHKVKKFCITATSAPTVLDIVEVESAQCKKEIAQCDTVIKSHCFMRYMAQRKLDALNDWNVSYTDQQENLPKNWK